jgi:hypothetical protein
MAYSVSFDPTGALYAADIARDRALNDARHGEAAWRDYAKSLEVRIDKIRDVLVSAVADSCAESALTSELISEAEGTKPARLSLRENRPLRQEFRAKAEAISKEKILLHRRQTDNVVGAKGALTDPEIDAIRKQLGIDGVKGGAGNAASSGTEVSADSQPAAKKKLPGLNLWGSGG